MGALYFQPHGGWAGDFIPFWEDGRFHLFYLHDFRDRAAHGEGTPWYQVSTHDFLHFEEHGEMLPRGGADEQDLYVFTGSVIRALGKYHIFYTGHNPYLKEAGKPVEAILHATSDDMLHWQKARGEALYAPEGYERDDLRDPFVFEEGGRFRMAVCARKNAGPSAFRGVTALYESKDLKNWSFQGNLWEPGLYYAHECPDLFHWGDWWYLIYSEFTDRTLTRYRMAKSLTGPWIAPRDDAFDGRAFYAAKTASDGAHRYLFGWVPTRDKNWDNGGWEWGGALNVHELSQRDDGTLGVRMPESVCRAWVPFRERRGPDELSRPDGRALSEIADRLPETFRIDADITLSDGCDRAGIILRYRADTGEGYFFALSARGDTLSFGRPDVVMSYQGLERPASLVPGERRRLTILADGGICTAYLEGGVALSARMCAPHGDSLALFADGGSARFENIRISTLRT